MLNLRSNQKQTEAIDPSNPGIVSLAALGRGATARIACLECACAARCERLMAYGLVQGQVIHLIQTSPAFVIRVDETELAFDQEVARCVRVEPL